MGFGSAQDMIEASCVHDEFKGRNNTGTRLVLSNDVPHSVHFVNKVSVLSPRVTLGGLRESCCYDEQDFLNNMVQLYNNFQS